MKNKNTKKEIEMINKFNYARYNGMSSLYDIYKCPSYYKTRIAEKLQDEAKQHNSLLYYCGGNTSTFSCAYDYYENGKHMLAYFTAYNTYIFEIF